MSSDNLPFCVAALYHFTSFQDVAAIRDSLQTACDALGIHGILLIAPEGINGTIAGSDSAIEEILGKIRSLPGCAGTEVKFSRAAEMPFL
ncbi:MAG: hypothetical protein GX413_00750, partial [Acetobacter sp.]|nr:hypothetical protein [Acetobacter sp.]